MSALQGFSRLAVAMGLVLLLIACGKDPSHAGGSSMEIPNSLALTLLDSVGKPLPQARVEVVNMETWYERIAANKPPEVFVLWANSQGIARGDVGSGRHLRVYAKTAGTGFIQDLSFEDDQKTQADTLHLARLVAGKGSLESDSGLSLASGKVRIVGTTLQALLDGQGDFVLDSVPPGNWGIVSVEGSATSPRLELQGLGRFETAADTSDLGVFKGSPGILVDGFSSADDRTELTPWWSSAIWFITNDASQGSSSEWTHPAMDGTPFGAAIHQDSSGIEGPYLHTEYALDTASSTAYLVLGIFMDQAINLGQMDSITFWMRGQGQFVFQVLRPGGIYPDHAIELSLVPDSTWKKVVIHPQDLHGSSGPSHNAFPSDAPNFEQFTRSIVNFQWIMGDRSPGNWLDLDEFVLHAMPGQIFSSPTTAN
jgi:hypothetical protein